MPEDDFDALLDRHVQLGARFGRVFRIFRRATFRKALGRRRRELRYSAIRGSARRIWLMNSAHEWRPAVMSMNARISRPRGTDVQRPP